MYIEFFTLIKRLLKNHLHGKAAEHSYVIAEITVKQLQNTSSTARITPSIMRVCIMNGQIVHACTSACQQIAYEVKQLNCD